MSEDFAARQQEQMRAGEIPEPGAAPAPVPAFEPEPAAGPAEEAEVTPQEMAPPPETAPQEDRPVPEPSGAQAGRISELEAELRKLRAEAIAGEKTLVRVHAPHVLFTHGGITVGPEPTPVPTRALGALLTAAGEAGVKITEEA